MTFNLQYQSVSKLMKKHLLIILLTGLVLPGISQPVVAPVDSTMNTTTPVQQNTPAPAPTQNESSDKDVKIYNLNKWVDVPLTLATGGWSGFAFTKIYSKPKSTVEEIMSLDKKDIPGIDRWAAGMSSDAADAASNYLFYGSIPVPFALFLDKDIRRDAGKISFLYLEAMAITG